MKLDKFLEIICGKLGLVLLIFAVLLVPLLTTACSLEDVFCLVFCGCLSPGTCAEMCKDYTVCSSRCEDAVCDALCGCTDRIIDCTIVNPYNSCMNCINSAISKACDCGGGYDSCPSCTTGCMADSCGADPKYQCLECGALVVTPAKGYDGELTCPECMSRLLMPLYPEEIEPR